MQQLLYVLPALVCPVGMGLMMWLMTRLGSKNRPSGDLATRAQEQELVQLRAEIADQRAGQQPGVAEPTGQSVSLGKPAGSAR